MYLDSTATTKPTDLAIDSFVHINSDKWHNPSTTMSEGGAEARRVIEHARESIAKNIGASPDKIIFTSGSTEGANMIIKGLIPRGHEQQWGIICSQIEHPAVDETCKYMAKCGVDTRFLPVNSNGEVDLVLLEVFLEWLQDKDYILVCIGDGNNETGVIQNTQRVFEIVHSHPGAYLFTDMTQSFAHAKKFKVDDLGYDFACASAHKFGGLKGSGFIYAKYPTLLTPLLHGGGQESRHRSGTENVAGIYSMALQFDEICKARDHGDLDYVEKLRNTLIAKLTENFGDKITINSGANNLPTVLSVTLHGQDANQAVTMLELQDIQVSAGSACHTGDNRPSRVLKAMGLSDDDARSTIRVSLAPETSASDINKFVLALRRLLGE